jgi:polysaccharide biosynthesis protein PslG
MRFHRVTAALVLASLMAVSNIESSGFGVNAHIPSNSVADRIEAGGISWVRIDFLWSLAEPEPDFYDWSVYDALVDRLEARGLKIYSGLGSTPAWATNGPEFSGVPDDVDQWREFCYLAALRYRGRIQAWGVWNEPNLDRFWNGSRQDYIDRILIPGSDAISLADPTALVCAPDLAHLSSADWDDWLRATINAAGDRMDVVTHHVYPSNGWAWEVTYDLETGGPFPFSPPSVQRVLEETGWWRRPFWLTETGVESERWGENRQANFVGEFLQEWFDPDRGHRDWIDRIFFYEMNDGPQPATYSWGLIQGPPGFVPKEAYLAYSSFIEASVVDDAELVSSDVPRFYRQGEPVSSTITLRNTGTTSWSRQDLIALVAEIDTLSWAVVPEQLGMDESVGPGEVRQFSLVITPPAIKGIGVNPVLSVRMERETSWPFGDLLRQEVVLTDILPPRVKEDPESAVIMPGQSTTLRVGAKGPEPLAYRWLRNGIALVDGDQWSGSESSELTVTALTYEVEAFYQCIVSNEAGQVVSGIAAVSIDQPAPRRGGTRVTPDSPGRIPRDVPTRLRVAGPPERR